MLPRTRTTVDTVELPVGRWEEVKATQYEMLKLISRLSYRLGMVRGIVESSADDDPFTTIDELKQVINMGDAEFYDAAYEVLSGVLAVERQGTWETVAHEVDPGDVPDIIKRMIPQVQKLLEVWDRYID